MANRTRLSTSVLLTCAAIGVAAGVLQAGAGALSGPVSAAVPILYGLVLGVHVLPGRHRAGSAARALGRPHHPPHRRPGRERRRPAVDRPLHRHRAADRRAAGGHRRARPLPPLGAVAVLPLGGHRRRRHRGRRSGSPPTSRASRCGVRSSTSRCSSLGPVLWTAVGLAIGAALRRAGVPAARTRLTPGATGSHG